MSDHSKPACRRSAAMEELFARFADGNLIEGEFCRPPVNRRASDLFASATGGGRVRP